MFSKSANANQIRVVGIGGSLRETSSTYIALDYAMGFLRRLGCSTHMVDLRKTSLPFCNGDSKELWPQYPGVAEMRATISRAHAVVLATPEYHGGISGVLKNALDLLTEEQLKGKVTGVISVLGGPANSNALNDLGKIMRACHAWVIPHYIAIGQAHTAFENGVVRDEALARRFIEFADSLVESASRICDFDETETKKDYAHEKDVTHPRVDTGGRNRGRNASSTNRKFAGLVVDRSVLPGLTPIKVEAPEVRG